MAAGLEPDRAESYISCVPSERKPREELAWEAPDWAAFLRDRLGHPVEVRYGRSRSVPIQSRWIEAAAPSAPPAMSATMRVRMHLMFRTAPPAVRDAVAHWMRSGRRARRACRLLDAWIAEQLAELPRASPRTVRTKTRGEHHDLLRLARPLWEGVFQNDFGEERPRPHLTWGRASRSRCRRSLRLGSYAPETHLVRVHAVLDQAAVPDWYLRCVLHHEILHAAVPPVRTAGGRWLHHGPDFRRRERAYPDHERAVAWEEANLARLIRSARTGSRLAVRRGERNESVVREELRAVQGWLF